MGWMLTSIHYRNISAFPKNETTVNPENDPGRITTIGGINERCQAYYSIWHLTRQLAKEDPELRVKELLNKVTSIFGN